MGAGMNPAMNPGPNGAMGAGMNGSINDGMGAGLNGGMGTGMDGARRGPPTGGGYRPGLRDLLLGSSFRLSAGGEDEYGAPRRLTAWGGASASRWTARRRPSWSARTRPGTAGWPGSRWRTRSARAASAAARAAARANSTAR